MMEEITQKEILESLANIGYRLKKYKEPGGLGFIDVYEFYSDNNSYTFSIVSSFGSSFFYHIKHDAMPESFSVAYSLAKHYMDLELDQAKRKRELNMTIREINRYLNFFEYLGFEHSHEVTEKYDRWLIYNDDIVITILWNPERLYWITKMDFDPKEKMSHTEIGAVTDFCEYLNKACKRQMAVTDCEKRILEIGYRRVVSPSVYAEEAYCYTNDLVNVYLWKNGSRIEAYSAIKGNKYVAFSKTEMRLFLARLVELEYGKEVK